MNLSNVIIGPLVTEKTERLKTERSYTLKVMPSASKIDVLKALQEFYDVEPLTVRVIRVPGKTRNVGPYQTFTKRHAYKKAIVTLAEKSKGLDLTKFKS